MPRQSQEEDSQDRKQDAYAQLRQYSDQPGMCRCKSCGRVWRKGPIQNDGRKSYIDYSERA